MSYNLWIYTDEQSETSVGVPLFLYDKGYGDTVILAYGGNSGIRRKESLFFSRYDPAVIKMLRPGSPARFWTEGKGVDRPLIINEL